MEQNMDSPTAASPLPEPEGQETETDYSSIRGKMILVSPTADEYDLLRKHLLERLDTGNGEVIYDIGHGEDGRGLTEDEYSASVATLQSLVSGERISCVELRRWDCGTGLTGQYLLRTQLDHNDFMEIREGNKWLRGEIIGKSGNTNYKILASDGTEIHRHIDQIKERSEVCSNTSESVEVVDY